VNRCGLKAKMIGRMYLWEDRSIEDIMAHYGLSAGEVHAAIAFYYDNQDALDAEYQQNLDLLREVGTSSEEFRAKIEARRQDTDNG
jgi:hypothetical protein